MRGHIKTISVLLAFLIVTLPICFATELNLQYDANGNLVTGDGLYRTYNSLNQLSKIYNGTGTNGTLLQEYVYDPTEERVAIKVDYTKNETTYYFTQSDVRVVNFNGSVYDYKYAYFEGQLVAQINPDGSKYYIHGNHEGSSSVVTNQSGAVIENTLYSPYGDILSGGNKTRYNSEGKEYDSVIKSTNFNFRMQGIAGTPPFQQPDDRLNNVYNPQELNRYAFERNNPIKNVDPTGHIAVADDAIVLVTVILAVYIGGQISMAIANKQKEEAEATGNPQKIREATANFYFNAVTAPLSIIFPESMIVSGYDYYSAISSGKTMLTDLVNSKQTDKSSPEQVVGSFNYKGNKVTIKTEATDKNGKTSWDKMIEKNKQESAKKEAQGLTFKGYDSNKKAIWK